MYVPVGDSAGAGTTASSVRTEGGGADRFR